ncbi:MAG: EamA family transporter RarD [Alphaproteobacteria bacterium]|nr:EamA family transporter RarD [Alphaproteobacteria bacterium]MDE2110185.1 EamA family transporter RarD [Alphaproteobacteria bacterium]MDE2492519.1 EamA family transporter RarD [Alphaproteobacteria bacterium]
MSKTADIAPPNEAAGILLAGSAYAIWGIFPLYWDLLAAVPPFELVIHRMLWCALFAAGVTAARGRLRTMWSVVRTKRLLLALALSGMLIAVNWTIYIYSIATAQLVEASLGYYITPLLSIALGVVMLGERLSRFRLAALALAAIAVGVLSLRLGHVPWIALGLALSFGFYGYVRKLTPVDSLDGLTIEMALFFPLSLGLILFWGWKGTGVFPSVHLSIDALLLLAGPVTAIPLALFAAGARRVRMTTLGFLQYLAPTITLLLATLFLGEKFTSTDAAVFGCVWAALLLVGLEGPVARSAVRQGA